MKILLCIYLILFIFVSSTAQPSTNNVFIITIDGVRWQEIFNGADSTLVHSSRFVKDTSLMMQQYWSNDPNERRAKLMPFVWSVIAKQGKIMGNRNLQNKVDVANLFKISYPGYSEIFTGYADGLFIPNLQVRNRNSNVLDYINTMPTYAGQVAAFCSWDVFPFILNEKKNNTLVNAGYEMLHEQDSTNILINQVQNTVVNKNNTRHDLLTYECANNYIEQHHPKVLYLALGETDEFAHKGEYDTYLRKMHQADALIAELWYKVQTDPFYKNNTTFIITTDHGRGGKTHNWNGHGFWVGGSGHTWMACIGKGVDATGEVNQAQQIYSKQIAPTIANLLGFTFIANHAVSKPLMLDTKMIKPSIETTLFAASK